MSKARHYTLEELQLKQQRISQRQAYLYESARRAAAREKALKKKITQQESDERLKRLVARGELLESLIKNAALLTNEQLSRILTTALSHTDVIAMMQRILPASPASANSATIETEASANE